MKSLGQIFLEHLKYENSRATLFFIPLFKTMCSFPRRKFPKIVGDLTYEQIFYRNCSLGAPGIHVCRNTLSNYKKHEQTNIKGFALFKPSEQYRSYSLSGRFRKPKTSEMPGLVIPERWSWSLEEIVAFKSFQLECLCDI